MKRKLWYILSITVILLGIFLLASCNGCDSCGGCNGCESQLKELKSDMGIVLQGGGFERGSKLITEKRDLSDEAVQKALALLPERCAAFEESDLAVIDISVLKEGAKVQPNGKVKITVPAPLKDVTDYVVYHVKSETEVEELACEYKDGQVIFETDSFSLYFFGDASVGEKITIKVEKSCPGGVSVRRTDSFFHYIYGRFYLSDGEETTVYVKQGGKLRLEVSETEGFYFAGWFLENNGVVEEKPFSTERDYNFVAGGEQTIVAKFYADLTGVYQLWHFPGTSNFPVAYADGRASEKLFLKPGNSKNYDIHGLVLKGLKRHPKTGKMMFVELSPDQYTVTGLDEVDYTKEGEYVVLYKLKDHDLKTRITLHISEDNPMLAARSTYGGKFRVEANYGVGKDTYHKYKEFILTGDNSEYTLIAEPKAWGDGQTNENDFEFDGWYELHEGGVIGEKLSDNAEFKLNRDRGDLTVLAVFKIKSTASNMKGVYQLRLFPGTSNIPAKENGNLVQELFYKPGAPEIDLLNIQVMGLRRTADDTDTELVPLYFGDYTIDYDGLDFRKEGIYDVDYNIMLDDHEYSGGFSVSISEKHANLTLEFEGNGRLEVERFHETVMTESGVPQTFGYFRLHDFRHITAVPDAGYRFVGWYSVDAEGRVSEQPVSTEAEYKFTQNGKDEHLKALFGEDVMSIDVTCDGFEYGFFHYDLSSKKQADLTGLTVTTNNGTVLDASEYIVDASRVDYTKTGDHEIIITYKHDKGVKATLMVNVPKAEMYCYLDNSEQNGIIKKGDVTVVDSPDGYREEIDLGGTITLTAQPNEGYKFEGWYINHSYSGEEQYVSSNATETFTLTDNTYIYARFVEKKKVTLTVIADERGNVYEYKEQGSCSPEKELQLEVVEGSKVKVSASGATVYYKFIGWYDGEGENATLISAEDPYEFTVDEDTTVYARFGYAFSIAARIEEYGAGEFVGVDVSEEGDFYVDDLPENASVTLEVKPKPGYQFVGWFVSADLYSAENLISTERKHTFVVNEQTGNLHLTALFRATVTEIKLADDPAGGFYLDNEGKLITEYVIAKNSEFYASPEGLPVLGKVGDEYRALIYGVEYKIDSTIPYNENGLFDTSQTGTFTITYTYLANPQLKATITIKVTELFSFLAQPSLFSGGQITENGSEVNFGNGRRVEKGTKITLTAVASEGYNFSGWYVVSPNQSETLITTNATCTFTVKEDMYVQAKFAEKEMYTFIAYPTEAGYFTENGQQVDFGNGRRVEKGTQITLTAHVKEAGYRFVGWYHASDQNETLISPNATCTFTVNEDMYVYAKFVEKEKFIFNAHPTEGGSITENGEEVDFGNGRRVEKGTQITLTAVVHENYNFAGWYYIHEQQVETQLSMNLTYTFTVNGNMHVYAKFVEKEMYTFFAYPTEAGYFTENGQPVEFSESRRVEKGTKITLTAHVREPDYQFVGWYHASDQNETLIATTATCTFTVDEDMYVYARFEEKEKFNFYAYAMGEGLILENGEAVDFGNGRRVEKGTKITLTAVASKTYNFVGWYIASDQNETLISQTATYTFTVNEDMYVYAKFNENSDN